MALISKRKPKVETERIDWVGMYDQHFQNNLATGLDERQAERKAFGACSMLWLQHNPMHPDHLPMGNKGICCFCGEKGADMPLSILGAGVMAHSGPGRAGKFELVPVEKITNWEPNCWDAMVLHLHGIAALGLWVEGLKVVPQPWEMPTQPTREATA